MDEKIILSNHPFIKLLIGSHMRIYRHILSLLFLGAVLYFAFYNENLIGFMIGAFFGLLLIFYTNLYFLIPYFLLENKYWSYLMSLIIINLISSFLFLLLFGVDSNTPKPVYSLQTIFLASFLIAILMAASTTIKFLQHWIKSVIHINELEESKLNLELQQLKNQINPHFLFNTLNNLNTLINKEPQKASTVLLELSDLLRYQLYDTTLDHIILSADIQFLRSFLSLDEIRRDKFSFEIQTQGNVENVTIPPLLFIPFVENASKYSLDTKKESFVKLYFTVDANELHFMCINSIPLRLNSENEVGGIGLTNIKRRLELLYKEDYILKINKEDGFFQVDLILKLN